MKKEKMVTRSFATATVIATAVNMETREFTELKYHGLPVEKDNSKYLKVIGKMYDTPTLKHMEVKGIAVEEKLYGIPESEFITLAVELDPTTRKPITAE